MTEKDMIEGHVSETVSRAESLGCEYLIAAQDTTYYNYSGQKQMAGLGVIQGNIKGIMQHNTLLMNDKGLPLGLIGQEYWTRKGDKDYNGIESEKWTRGLENVNHILGKIKQRVILVQDREADIFDFFTAKRESNIELLVRVFQARNMEVVLNNEIGKLENMPNLLTSYGEKVITITHNSKELNLSIDLYSDKINVLRGKEKTEGLTLVAGKVKRVVDAKTGKEVSDDEYEKSTWNLLTSITPKNKEEVEQILAFYALRWRVERFHYTMKTGALNVEKMQFDDIHTTINALAFYSVVAWQLLAITYLTRDKQDEKAEVLFEKTEVELLEKLSKCPIITIKNAVLAMAKLLGFAPSKKQPMPGIKVLCQALERFHYIKLGAALSPPPKPLQD